MRTPYLKVKEIDIEYLSTFISGSGIPNKKSDKVATEVLSRIPLYEINDTPSEDLKEIGLSDIQIKKITAAFNLVRKAQSTIPDFSSPLTCSRDVYQYIINNKEAFPYDNSGESFFVIGLSMKQCITGVSLIGKGTMAEVQLQLSSILREAIKMVVPRIMLAHNHPSGNPNPSDSDIRLTQQVEKSMDVVGLSLMDHIVIGQGSYYSFADYGFIK
ncbi:hypothetical protein KKH23_04295 [Patescibacteria group bacterium]|nr:hypothetical protein [Patescibacteria group bacterium]MBU0846386.1 hypothetical protein [Patescibacteria group bacterium]